MTDTTSLILSPYQRDGITVRNRLAVAPMTRITATENGHPTQTMFDYYLRFAEGGFGLVTTEGIYTDKAFSQGYRFQPGLADDEQAWGWTAFIRDMQKRGAHVVKATSIERALWDRRQCALKASRWSSTLARAFTRNRGR